MSTFFISNHHSFAGAKRCRRDSNGLEVRARCRETRSRTGRGGADLDLGGRNRHARKSRKERAKRGRVSNLRFRQRLPCSVRGTRWITPDTASRHADTVASSAASAVLSDVSRVCTSVRRIVSGRCAISSVVRPTMSRMRCTDAVERLSVEVGGGHRPAPICPGRPRFRRVALPCQRGRPEVFGVSPGRRWVAAPEASFPNAR